MVLASCAFVSAGMLCLALALACVCVCESVELTAETSLPSHPQDAPAHYQGKVEVERHFARKSHTDKMAVLKARLEAFRQTAKAHAEENAILTQREADAAAKVAPVVGCLSRVAGRLMSLSRVPLVAGQ